MKKLFLILILSFYLNGISHSIDVPIIKSGSFVELESRGGKTNDYTIKFFDNNKCTYSYWDLWTTTKEDCSWKQEGPNVEIRMGKGGMLGRFSGGNYISYFVTTAGSYEWSGFLENYTHIWKNWISEEEKERLAEQKRIAEEKKRQDEYQKNLQKKVEEYEKQKKLDDQNKINKTKNSNNKTNRYIEIFFLIIIAPIIILTAIRFIYWPFFRDWIYKPFKENPERFIKRAAAILFGLAILGAALGGGGDYGCEPRFFQEGARC